MIGVARRTGELVLRMDTWPWMREVGVSFIGGDIWSIVPDMVPIVSLITPVGRAIAASALWQAVTGEPYDGLIAPSWTNTPTGWRLTHEYGTYIPFEPEEMRHLWRLPDGSDNFVALDTEVVPSDMDPDQALWAVCRLMAER